MVAEEVNFAAVKEALAAAGRYRLLAPISKGAFGLVARAHLDGEPGPDVALKCLRLG